MHPIGAVRIPPRFDSWVFIFHPCAALRAAAGLYRLRGRAVLLVWLGPQDRLAFALNVPFFRA